MNLIKCTSCGIEKDIGEFEKRKDSKLGHRTQCRICVSKRRHVYYEAHIDSIAIHGRIYRQESKEKISIRRKAYYERDREKSLSYHKIYDANHVEQKRVVALKWMYGISVSEFNSMLENQSGVCAICGKPERHIDKRTGKIRHLSVDHDHSTGHIRGLLCGACNSGIGHLQDDLNLLRKAVAYLESFTEEYHTPIPVDFNMSYSQLPLITN